MITPIPNCLHIVILLPGLFLHRNGVLAASPDAISNDFVVEIKCPYKFRNQPLTKENLTVKEKYVIIINADDSIEINKKHDYYSQIQGQIHLCNKKYGYLVIWTPINFKVVRVNLDEEWTQSITAMEDFYYTIYLPYLLLKNT